jgi:hypothetical protein
MTTDRSGSRIRSFLDLSTNNLPQEVFTELTSFDGVVAYPTTHGALLWVPDDPQSFHDFADEPPRRGPRGSAPRPQPRL